MKKNYLYSFKHFALSIAIVLLTNIKMHSQTADALGLDGVDDYVLTNNFGNAMDVSRTGVTIEAWIRAEEPGVIVTELGQSSINTAWHDSQIEVLASGDIYVRVWGLPSVFVGNIKFNNWNHIALRHNTATGKLDGLLNGIPSGSSVFGGRQNAYNWYIGQCYYALGATDGTNLGSGAFFKGKIDEVRFWNVPRTDCQINTYMNCEIPTSAVGLVANYHFNQGAPGFNNIGVTTLTDASGASNHASLNSFALNGPSSNWLGDGGVVAGYTTTLSTSLTVNSGTICNGSSFSIIPNPPGAYIITGGSYYVSPSSNTSYTVTGIVSGAGCVLTTTSAVSTVSVSVLPAPTISLSSSKLVVCLSEEVSITASGGVSYLWSGGGVTNPFSFYPTASGTHTVYGTGSNGCVNSATISITTANCTAIEELKSENLFSLYPNPSNGEFFLDLNTENTTVTIFDAIGNIVYNEKLNSGKQQINLNNHAAGLYFIQAKNNNATSSARLIKE